MWIHSISMKQIVLNSLVPHVLCIRLYTELEIFLFQIPNMVSYKIQVTNKINFTINSFSHVVYIGGTNKVFPFWFMSFCFIEYTLDAAWSHWVLWLVGWSRTLLPYNLLGVLSYTLSYFVRYTSIVNLYAIICWNSNVFHQFLDRVQLLEYYYNHC